MDSEQTSLNPSSLIDLKAELHKRYESFQRAKVIQKAEPARHTAFKRKGEPTPKEKKPAPVTKTIEEINEEELSLKKSRLALEAKAKLYERITSNNVLIDDEEGEQYLVDFNRKILYGTPVPAAREKTEDLQNNLSSFQNSNSVPSNSPNSTKDIYSERLPASFCHSEKSTEDEVDEEAIHYQNIQFNEVRDHGTGYFAFSMDEAKRKEQMEELNSLRQKTEEQRLFSQKLQKKRSKALEARLAKICERRNIDKSVVQMYTTTQETENVEDAVNDVDLSSIPLPETPKVTEKKEVKVRPWDIGKTDFPAFVPEKHKIRTQSDWIKERRAERQSEFAPPSAYSYK